MKVSFEFASDKPKFGNAAPIVIEQLTRDPKAAIIGGAAEGYDAMSSGDLYYSPGFIPAASRYGVVPIYYLRAVMREEKLDQQNGIHKRILEIIRDHIYGRGVQFTVKANDEKLKGLEPCLNDIVNKFHKGERNKVKEKIPQWIYEQCLAGEIHIPVSVNPTNGDLMLGYIPARFVTDIALNWTDSSDATAIKVQEGRMFVPDSDGTDIAYEYLGQPHVMKVVRYDSDPWERDEKGSILVNENNIPQKNPDFNRLSGDCFTTRTGNLIGQSRGQGDLFASADSIIKLEQALVDFIDRYNVQAALTYDITVTGMEEDEIKKRYGKLILPVGRRPFLHNDKVILKMLSPEVKVQELTELLRTIMRFVCAIAGIPEFMMADGTSTNVATAQEQTPALYAKFDMRRDIWSSVLKLMLRYAIEQKSKHQKIYFTDTNDDGVETQGKTYELTNDDLDGMEIGIDWLPFERSNSDMIAKIIKAVMDVLTVAIQQKLLSKQTGQEVLWAQLSQIDAKITPETERQRILEEGEASQQTTASGNPVDFQDVDN